jgi:ribosomal protein S18 acetylase RimI-like enzyme
VAAILYVPHADELARELVASDCRYFEAGARIHALGPGEIARLPGFETIAAGCVVQRLRPERLHLAGVPSWIAQVEDRLRALGAALSRWYVVGDAADLSRALAAAGYARRTELGFLLDAQASRSAVPGLSLRAVETDRHWAAKLRLHRRAAMGPDGHETPPRLWVDLERRKAATGYMRPYLVELEGAVCGAVSASRQGPLLRMKNIVIDPAFRRRGLATAVARGFGSLAAAAGCAAAGCFGVDGDAGARVYRRAGYRVVTEQIEWIKPLVR